MRSRSRTDRDFCKNISSGRNFKFTVHLYVKTRFISNDLEIYSTGKVDKKGYPSRSWRRAHRDIHINVSCKPVATSSTNATPGAYSNIFIFIDTNTEIKYGEKKELEKIIFVNAVYYICRIETLVYLAIPSANEVKVVFILCALENQ